MSTLSRNLVNILGSLHKFAIEGSRSGPVYGWRDLTAPLTESQSVGANTPNWATFRDGIEALSFSATTMNEAWVTFHPDHDVAEGEEFFLHVHWSPTTTSTGVVRWGFEYTYAAGFDQAAFPATTTIYVEETISADKQYQHMISEVSTGVAMPEVDSLILVRCFRDAAHANDTFPDAVSALTVDLHYRTSKFATIGKRPDFNVKD